MTLLRQIGIVFGIAYCGHLLTNGLMLPLPASVIGLVLLLAGLRTGLIHERWIAETSHFLSANMAFLFLPSAVEILDNYTLIHSVLAQLLIICVISTALTFLATYYSVVFFQKTLAKRGNQ